MNEKAPLPLNLLDVNNATPLIEAWYEIVHLKQLYRKGWLLRGVEPEHCETVAEHSFGNALLCLLLAPRQPGLDLVKVLRLALIHDLGEVYVGDLTPLDGVTSEEKHRLEAVAVEKILGKLPGGDALIADWKEYESQVTPEAKFVKQIDRLELAMQASVYHSQGKIDADEFHQAAARHVSGDMLAAELRALMTLAG